MSGGSLWIAGDAQDNAPYRLDHQAAEAEPKHAHGQQRVKLGNSVARAVPIVSRFSASSNREYLGLMMVMIHR